MDAAQRSLGEGVGRDQSQAEHAHPVDAVYGLEKGRDARRTVRGRRDDLLECGLGFIFVNKRDFYRLLMTNIIKQPRLLLHQTDF